LLQTEIQLDERTPCSHPIKPYKTLGIHNNKKTLNDDPNNLKRGKVKTYDLEVKNPLKQPPIGVKKKVT
jgi:hypothetical protein